MKSTLAIWAGACTLALAPTAALAEEITFRIAAPVGLEVEIDAMTAPPDQELLLDGAATEFDGLYYTLTVDSGELDGIAQWCAVSAGGGEPVFRQPDGTTQNRECTRVFTSDDPLSTRPMVGDAWKKDGDYWMAPVIAAS